MYIVNKDSNICNVCDAKKENTCTELYIYTVYNINIYKYVIHALSGMNIFRVCCFVRKMPLPFWRT